MGGTVRAVAKIVDDNEGRARVPEEARILKELAGVRSVREFVPRLARHLSTTFGEVLVTDAFEGTPPPLVMSAPVRAFLGRCHLSGPRSASDSTLIRRTFALAAAAGYRELFCGALLAMADESVPVYVTHGDFVPWNMRIRGPVAKVFDWEFGCVDGVPDWDALYFHVQVGIVHNGWNASQLLGALREWLHTDLPSWSRRGQHALAVTVLLDLAARYQRRGDQARERLVVNAARALVAMSPHHAR